MKFIIPFTFYPGEKARAEEVNANFQAVSKEIDNVNEKIKNSTATWGNIAGTLSNQTDLQNQLDNKITKQDPVPPLGFNSKTSVTINGETGIVRINPIGFISGYSAYFPDVLPNSVNVPTTKKGNMILDKTQVLMYEGPLDDVTITFPNQFTRNKVGARVIIGNLNDGIFTPHIWVDDTTLYTGDDFSIYNTVNCGVPETVYMGGSALTPSTTTSADTTNSITITDSGGDAEVIAKLQVAEDLTANRNLFDIQTSIPTEDLNCVVFGLLTGNGLYYASDFSIDNSSGNVWIPTCTVLREYLTLSLGSSTGVSPSGQLQVVGVNDSNDNNNNAAIKTWTGTKEQYDAILTKDATTLYNITDDSDVTFQLLELLFPVGAVYFGTMSVCPLQVLGVGTWQLVASDKVLQGAGTRGSVGDTLEAGLPNITGTFSPWSEGNSTATGAFYVVDNKQKGNNSTGDSDNTLFGFDASLSSSIYGNSNTVQPPAYIVNIWERIS